jgi:hypothetical protein
MNRLKKMKMKMKKHPSNPSGWYLTVKPRQKSLAEDELGTLLSQPTGSLFFLVLWIWSYMYDITPFGSQPSQPGVWRAKKP